MFDKKRKASKLSPLNPLAIEEKTKLKHLSLPKRDSIQPQSPLSTYMYIPPKKPEFPGLSEATIQYRTTSSLPDLPLWQHPIVDKKTGNKLQWMADGWTQQDLQHFTDIIDKRRQFFNWKQSEPLAYWPTWHESVQEQKIDIVSVDRKIRRQHVNSPVIAPMPVDPARSPSPIFQIETEKRQVSPTRSMGSPMPSENEPEVSRPKSDGDLSMHLKGFSELKRVLAVAQQACKSEVSKILSELSNHMEFKLHVEIRSDNRPKRRGPSIELRDRSPLRLQLNSPLDSSMDSDSWSVSSRNSESSRRASMSTPPHDRSSATSRRKSEQPFNKRLQSTSPERHSPLVPSFSSDVESHFSNDEDIPETGFLKAVKQLTSVAQTILDVDLASLMIPATSRNIVAQIQNLQQEWQLNPSWPLQMFPARLLIVFAGVARLVENIEEDTYMWMYMVGEGAFSFVSHKPNRRRGSLAESSPRRGSVSSMHSSGVDSDVEDERGRKNVKRIMHFPVERSDNSRMTLPQLKKAVDQSQQQTIILELNTSGLITYVSPIVKQVLGYEPTALINQEPPFVSSQLLMDGIMHDYRSFELCFRARRSDGTFLPMQAKGMINESTKQKSFTYVLRQEMSKESPDMTPLSQDVPGSGDFSAPMTPASALLTPLLPTVDLALCHVCERQIPAIAFTDHAPLCAQVHQQENEIILGKDMLRSLLQTLQDKQTLIQEEIDQESKMELNPLRRAYLDYLHRLFDLSKQLLNQVQAALSTHVPKWDEGSIGALNHLELKEEPKLEFEMPDQIKFEPPDKSIDGEQVQLDQAVLEIGLDLFQLYTNAQTIVQKMASDIQQLIPKLISYREANQEEEDIKHEISVALEAQRMSQTVSESSSIVNSSSQLQSLSQLSPYSPSNVLSQQSFSPSSMTQLPTTTPNSGSNSQLEKLFKPEHKSIENLIREEIPREQPRIPREKSVERSLGELSLSRESLTTSLKDRDSLGTLNTDFVRNSFSNSTELLRPRALAIKSSKSFDLGREADVELRLERQLFDAKKESFGSLKEEELMMSRRVSQVDQPRKTSVYRAPRVVVGADKSLELDTSTLRSPTIPSSSPLSAQSMFPDRIQPSIKDYQIIKAISKGAFGSVFLAKKKITGEYFAIKVLKKSDMVVKNQVMNVKAERTILTQLDSPFVVKLYYSFQSANHIYLVMEYLPGGDCAALLKSVQQLDEPWTRQYISEIVLGLEFLHERDIIHRDLKPDNLLIDAKGHIKLTDFGLSKVGFLGRRAHQTEQKQSSLVNSPSFSQLLPASPSFGSLSESPKMSVTQQASSPLFPQLKLRERRQGSFGSFSSVDSFQVMGGRLAEKLDEREHKNNFVGTPDYLAPECIVGYGQGPSVDWWAVGVIMYEFLLGIPPFNAMTTTQVFENIVMRRIDWMEDEVELTMEAKDLMDKLMCTKVEDRLGTQSTDQVKAHPWFNNLDWKSVWEQPAPFTPTIKGLEDTDYFDARGAKDIEISDDPLVQQGTDFGESVYKNLNLLEKANQKIVSKIKSEFPTGERWMQKRRDSLPQSFNATRRKSHFRNSSTGSTMTTSTTNLLKPESSKSIGSKSTESRPIIRPLDVFIADDNPITSQILETILQEYDCKCLSVRNGAEAVRCLMGQVRFDVIFTSLVLPVLDGYAVARMVKSMTNINQATPIIAMCFDTVEQDVFDHVLVHPISKQTIERVLERV